MSAAQPLRSGLLLRLVGLVMATAVAVGLQAQENGGRDDLYGYTVFDGPEAGFCGYQYIPLEKTGKALTLVRGHAGAADDDLAALVPLAEPFDLYQQPVESLVVSGNGYLAAATGFAQDDGSDFSNDCALPARPDNPNASANRIHAYHDDLRPQAGAQVRHAYFPDCPRAADTGAVEACTVVEWDGFESSGPIPSTNPLRMQTVLYHGSHQVVMQYASVDDSRARSATIGLQGFDGRTSKTAGCNSPDRVAARRAVCYFDPRHRQGSVPAGTVLR